LRNHLSPDASIDLQLHTTYSDGRWSAEQLFDHLAAEGFDLVAVTDHDRVDTVASVQQLGEQKGVSVLTAVEISAQWRGKMADVLCFGFDPEEGALRVVADHIRQRAAENAQEVYDELERRGYRFPRRDEILAARQGKLRVAHDCAKLLMEHDYVKDWPEAYKIIRDAGYREMKAGLAETVEAVHSGGGIALIAHPGRGKLEPLMFTDYTPQWLDELRAEIPLDGIEVYHPTHTPELIATYQSYVEQHNLLFSAGSDSHGPPGRMPIKHRADLCRPLLERVGIEVGSTVL
jgi:3',5'-nucleoside bisphosphate phosphatase